MPILTNLSHKASWFITWQINEYTGIVICILGEQKKMMTNQQQIKRRAVYLTKQTCFVSLIIALHVIWHEYYSILQQSASKICHYYHQRDLIFHLTGDMRVNIFIYLQKITQKHIRNFWVKVGKKLSAQFEDFQHHLQVRKRKKVFPLRHIICHIRRVCFLLMWKKVF